MYKFIDGTDILMNPQPSGYPVTLRHKSGTTLWDASLTSLTNLIALNDNPPQGSGGGDPHIKNFKGDQVLIPNDWKYVKLYQKDNIQVNAKCSFINKEIIDNLHCINKTTSKIEQINIDKRKHKYVLDYTYFTEIDLIKNNELVFKYDVINDKELINKNINLETNNIKKGIFSLTHNSYYPPKNLSTYFINLNNNNVLSFDIDNFWDDINNLKISLFDNNFDGYSGEFFSHSIKNKLE
jgi:hypothetical protein